MKVNYKYSRKVVPKDSLGAGQSHCGGPDGQETSNERDVETKKQEPKQTTPNKYNENKKNKPPQQTYHNK